MLSRLLAALAIAGALTLTSDAAADPVDNPGDFTITIGGGYFAVGTHSPQERFNIDALNPPVVSGTITDTSGTTLIPSSGISFPPTDRVVDSPIGPITVHITIVPTSDGSGNLNAVTGLSTVNIAFRIHLTDDGGLLTSNCFIGPPSGISINLTTDASGTLNGIPYDQTTGLAGYVDNGFAVPGASGCCALGLCNGSINSSLGIPAAAGINKAVLLDDTDPTNPVATNQFAPIFTGS
jgi:hypothetical protein